MKFLLLACISLISLYGVCAQQTVFNFTQGKYTFLERLDLSMNIEYSVGNNATKIGILKLPQDATVDVSVSSVTDTKATLSLIFGPLNVNNITQQFEVKQGMFSMTSMEIGVTFDDDTFPGANDEGVMFNFEDMDLFNTPVGSSYQCDASVQVKEEADEFDSQGFSMTFSKMQLQPFGVKDKKFSEAKHCTEDLSTSTSQPGKTTDLTTASDMTTPAPPHDDDKWVVKDKDGKICIMEKTNVHFKFHEGNDTTYFSLVNATVDQSESKCGNATQKKDAVLRVYNGTKNNYFMQTFGSDGKNFFLYKLAMNITFKGKGHHYSFTMKDNSTYETPIGNALKCVSNVTIKSDDKKDAKNYVEVSFSNVTLQPYDIKGGKFSKNFVCPDDNAISNIVPIAVGCALAVLVIIVLIAYLIGRRNSSRSGYESV